MSALCFHYPSLKKRHGPLQAKAVLACYTSPWHMYPLLFYYFYVLPDTELSLGRLLNKADW